MPAQSATHPSAETLRALGLGKLDDAAAQTVLRHLESCPDCRRKATSLSDDSFLDRLRAVHSRNQTPGTTGPFSLILEETPHPHSPAETVSASLDQRAAGAKAPLFPQQFPFQFGRYRILKLLGRGGMGSVYLAQDTQLDRRVALKIPHVEAGDGSQVLERFCHEARAAAAVHHAGICPLYDVGEIEGTPYLIMAYVEGKPLAELMRERPLTARQSAVLVRKLALALQEAHKRGVIHRDLKPANVMIEKRGEPIIMDFGLARRTRTRDPRLTQRGYILGTPAYMPPEQISGDAESNGAVGDIYSLGVIFYELLTGRLPFTGDAIAIVSKALMDVPPPPSAIRPDLDPELEAICLKAMAKKIEDRYAAMTELAEALTVYLRSKPAPAPATPAPKQEAAIAPVANEDIRVSQLGGRRSVAMVHAQIRPRKAEQAPGPGPNRRRRRRLPAWTWLVGATVALGLSGLVFWGATFLFKVMTKDGILVVEVNESDAEVYVDGNRMTVTWGDGGKKAEISVQPGTHKVEIKKDGFKVSGQSVTLAEGGKEPLRVWLEKLPPSELKESVSAANLASAKDKERKGDKGELLHLIRWERNTRIYSAHFTPDSRFCLLSGDKDLTLLYDVQTGKPVGKRMKGYINAIAPGSERIITGEWTRSTFHVYDFKGNETFKFGGTRDLWNFWLLPRGDRLLTSTPVAHHLLNLNDGTEIKQWPCEQMSTYVLSTPNGRYLLRQVDGKLPWHVYDASTGEEVEALKNLTRIQLLRGFFPDNRRAYALTSDTLSIHGVSSGTELGKVSLGNSPVAGAVLSPDGKRLLARHGDWHVRLWDLDSGEELCSFPIDKIDKPHNMSLAFSPDGRYACVGGTPGWVYLWRLPRP